MKEKIILYLEEEIDKHERFLSYQKKRRNELNKYDNLVLIPSYRKGGYIYYYVKESGMYGSDYLGSNTHPIVSDIKEAHYLDLSIERTAENIKTLKEMISKYQPLNYNSINEALPMVYQNGQLKALSNVKLDTRVKNWLNTKKKYKEEMLIKYPDKHPEELKHRAFDGNMFRSKGEVIIADALYMSGIPYISEYPYFLDDELYRFDFTTLSLIDYKSEPKIEHQGMMDIPEYRAKYEHTLLACLDNNIIPNVDIFFTFDTLSGNFDARQIEHIIKTKLLPQK